MISPIEQVGDDCTTSARVGSLLFRHCKSSSCPLSISRRCSAVPRCCRRQTYWGQFYQHFTSNFFASTQITFLMVYRKECKAYISWVLILQLCLLVKLFNGHSFVGETECRKTIKVKNSECYRIFSFAPKCWRNSPPLFNFRFECFSRIIIFVLLEIVCCHQTIHG